jgi:hypothetical protein
MHSTRGALNSVAPGSARGVTSIMVSDAAAEAGPLQDPGAAFVAAAFAAADREWATAILGRAPQSP